MKTSVRKLKIFIKVELAVIKANTEKEHLPFLELGIYPINGKVITKIYIKR